MSLLYRFWNSERDACWKLQFFIPVLYLAHQLEVTIESCDLKRGIGCREHSRPVFKVLVLASRPDVNVLLWSPYGIGQTIIFSCCGSFFLSFFPRLISAVGDWMSTILPHMVWPQCKFRMQVWNVVRAARWKCRTQKIAKNRQKIAIWAPSHNFVGL